MIPETVVLNDFYAIQGLAHFPCSQCEVNTREHRPITEKGILRRVSVSIFKIISKFKEADIKLVLLQRREKLLKDIEKPSAHTQRRLIKYLDLQKYLSRDTVPLTHWLSKCYRQFPSTPCFIHRVNGKPLGTIN